MCGVAGALWLTGCCCLKSPAPAARVDNVYRAAAKVQAKRVAVLPISVWPDDWQAAEGAVALEPVLRSELGKKQRFEIAGVTADELRAWTGRPTWRADEMLPHDLFAKLQLGTGCDAVLFTHLGAYQPYEPIVMGWTMKLVDAQTSAILWAVDEVFDGTERPAKAECVGRALGLASVESTPQTMLLSPRGFGEYTFSALLATLPHISQ
jgi:hypothetical protein